MAIVRHASRMAKALLRRLGYDVHRIPSPESLDHVAALTVKESQYYTVWSAACPIFSPWIGHPEFEAIYEGVAPHTVVSRDRCYMLVSLGRYAAHLGGDFAECGVYTGGTALLLARILTGTGKTLYLFDSFRGLPKANREHDLYFGKGATCSHPWVSDFSNVSVETVRLLLQEFKGFVDIREGWIPETFEGLGDRRYAFVHIDVDLYQSALDCCQYFYSRLVPGGVLVFDEYGFPGTRGEKDAVDEFFEDKREVPITLPTGQAIVLKVPPEQMRSSPAQESRVGK